MADESTTGVPYTQPYPYLRKISALPDVTKPSQINISDLLILVQSTTTKKVAIEHLMSRIVDLIDAPDAYQLACRNGFEGTLQEWLDSLKGEGVNPEELGWVIGKYQMITGSMDINPGTGECIDFVRDGTLPIAEDAFLIYRDVNTGKLYTKSVHGDVTKWHEWDGLLDPFTYINEVIGAKGNVPTYNANKRSTIPFSVVTIDDPYAHETVSYDYLDGVRDLDGNEVYHWNESDFSQYPSLGEMVRFQFVDDKYGKLMFYDGNHFYDYTGVLDYVQMIVNNMHKINAGSASRLQVARIIDIVSDITDDRITDVDAISFDGSQNCNFVIHKINGRVIYGDMPNLGNVTMSGNLVVGGTITAGGRITANGGLTVNGSTQLNGSLDVTGNTSLHGNLTVDGSSTFNGTATFKEAVTFKKKVTMENDLQVYGNISSSDLTVSSITITGTSSPITYKVSGSGISSTAGKFYSYGSSNNVDCVITSIAGSMITGKVASATSADSASRADRVQVGAVTRVPNSSSQSATYAVSTSASSAYESVYLSTNAGIQFIAGDSIRMTGTLDVGSYSITEVVADFRGDCGGVEINYKGTSYTATLYVDKSYSSDYAMRVNGDIYANGTSHRISGNLRIDGGYLDDPKFTVDIPSLVNDDVTFGSTTQVTFNNLAAFQGYMTLVSSKQFRLGPTDNGPSTYYIAGNGNAVFNNVNASSNRTTTGGIHNIFVQSSTPSGNNGDIWITT